MNKLVTNHNFIKLNNKPYDLEVLRNEVKKAENHHTFMSKACKGWESIPLRSVGGVEGKLGNLGGGMNNSPDPNDYKDTSVMTECPYIKSILDSFGTDILKVRIMKLIKGKKIATHIDNFKDDNIIRLHIPITTNPDVRFIVENDDQNLKEGNLYWVNVRKPHRVENKSKNDRVHLVFDLIFNDKVEKLFV
jgi:hypothetical protein